MRSTQKSALTHLCELKILLHRISSGTGIAPGMRAGQFC